MLCWLASYPRSGNTFTRIILNQIFGIRSTTSFGLGGEHDFVGRLDVPDIVGVLDENSSGAELIEKARRSDALYMVKTHEWPSTDDPAIYVLRDGRASVMSYYHYTNDIAGVPRTLEEVIRGDIYAGSWANHVFGWAPDTRPRTLLVRYEDLIADTKREVERIAAFLGVEAQKSIDVKFDTLHERFPQFFRVGNNERNIGELADSGMLELFWRWHTPMMHRFGYPEE
jgi:hypothetical protein